MRANPAATVRGRCMSSMASLLSAPPSLGRRRGGRAASDRSAGRPYNRATMAPSDVTPDDLRRQALDALGAVRDAAALESWRAEWLGRNDGRVTLLLRSIREQ